jgi:DNA-binding helix-hairpin-helix protein with protein kinase domain
MAIVTLLPGSRNLPSQLTISDQPVHTGGEGSIFFSVDDRYAVKIYHCPPPDKQKLLQHVLDLGRNLGEDEQFLAWPLGIVDRLNGQPKVGVVTRRVPASYVPLYKLIYSPVEAVEQFRQGRSWLEYLKMARGVAAAVRTIHGKGMAHADIHLKNFLANPLSGEVVLIDLDGLVVKGFLPPQVKGMPGFIAQK